MGDDSEWLKLPTEDKCQHKAWKARVAGYEEAAKLFHGLDEKSQEFSRYSGLIKKFVIDSNAVAQEKGLDAVHAFVENAPVNICGRTCSDVVSGIVSKCLNASRQKTKDKGIDIIMLYIEAEKSEVVQECLMAGMENKQPKVVVGCVQATTIALRDFGTKIILVKPLLKVLPKLLEDRDKAVREETKALVIELYRWIGEALKPLMTHFKPIQVQELESEFQNLPRGQAQQTRFMRSQQELKAKMEERALDAAAGGDAGDDESTENDEVDAYELMQSEDILSKLPANFYEQIEAKKWQDRKEALDSIVKLSEALKIESGDFSQLVRTLLKVISKDINVMLVALAVKILAGIAKGLRKKFQPYATMCVSTLLEKFKEKKSNVVTALREAIDACYASINLEVIMDDVAAALDNKNPSIKAETAMFLARCFSKCTAATLPKKILKTYVASLLKTVNESDQAVREGSFEALGVAMKVVSDKNIAPFLTDVDNIKMLKIQECCQKAVLLNEKGEPRFKTNTAEAKAPPGKSAAVKKPDAEEPKPVKRPGGPSGATAAKPKGKPTKGPAKKGATAKKEEKIEPSLSDEAVDEKAQTFLPGDILTNLLSANYKERLTAMESFIKVVSSTSKDDIPCQVCMRVLNKKPGLKDTNFQVLKLKLELVAHLTRNSNFSKRSAEFCLPDIIEKLGDAKNGGVAKDCLTGMTEVLGLDFIGLEVVNSAFEKKNPKNQLEALLWLTTAIQEFGFKVNVKALIATINKALAATNPGIRSAAITLLGVMFMYVGENLRMFFDKEKPALLQQINDEFDKMKDVKPPAPIRKVLGDEDAEGDGKEENGEDEEDEDDGDNNVADLLPRTDISEKITEEIINELADKNWKVRDEALKKIITILSDAKFLKPSLGPLPEALKARLGESNKNLQMTTITICATLATALGPHCKAHFKVIGPGLLMCLADSKPVVREKVISCLNVWTQYCTLLPLVENEALFDALKSDSPFLRAELLGWLAELLPTHKQLPAELRSIIPLVLTCLEDRNPDVRKRATDSLVPIMIHTGYDAFLKALGKCKPASKDQIQPVLDKAKGEVPAKPAKAKKAAPASAAGNKKFVPKSAPPAAAVPSRFDEPEDDEPQAAAKSDSKSKVAKGKGKPAPPTTKKKDDEDFGPTMNMTVSKDQRVKEEKAMKVLKWNFIELRGEFIDQLKGQMEKNFNRSIMVDLFHIDFKNHIRAIEQLIKCIETQERETLNNLDLLLKWLTIRFFDTNPSMLNKALDYIQQLFSLLTSLDYHLSDLEAGSFIPYLIMKSGDPKDNVRRDVRNILKQMCKIYPSSKMFSFIIDGLKCKVAKQRAELLEELGCLIENYGMNVCQPSPAHALKILAGQISDRDNSVRNAALNTIVIAYTILGESVYKYIGTLTDKDQSLLDERIKRAMKNKEMKPKEPLQPQAQPQQRPKTAPAGVLAKAASQPNMSAHLQPYKKTYQLDIEPEDNWEPVVPSLIELDLEALMAPVTKPKIMARPASPNMSSKLLGLADVSASIGTVVSQISDVSISTSIKALAQIDEVLKDEGKAEVMANHIDNLLVVITMQCKLGISKHLMDTQVESSEVIRLYRCLLSTLLSIFDKTSMGKKASTNILKDLMHSLLTVLLDTQIEQLEEGPQIIRTVNVTVVKIINKSDPTNITCAIISLMRECLLSETCPYKFLDLVIKCLWKILNLVPDNINDLNCDKVLFEAHLFFQQFPTSSWKSRPNLDMPIRTIKTLLHNLTKLKGHKILSHTGLIGASENSEVEAYLHTVLSKSNYKQEDGGAERIKSSSKTKRVSKTHELLTEIFKKIGTKENTREGLNDLFDFKKKYPEADVDPFLRKTSPHFQKYINNMLSEIEEERRGKKFVDSANMGYHNSADENACNTTGTSDADLPDVDYYREKLRELRARCGLDGNPAEADSNKTAGLKTSQNTSDLSDEPETMEIKWPSSAQTEEEPKQSVDVTSLKARLERIKKMANN